MTEAEAEAVPFVNTAQHAAMEREESRRQLSEAQVELVRNWRPPAVIAAGEEHTLYCQWCLLPFRATVKRSGRFRDSIEFEPLRKLLLIADNSWEPMICDTCFPNVMRSARRDSNSADDPERLTNFLLRVAALEKKG